MKPKTVRASRSLLLVAALCLTGAAPAAAATRVVVKRAPHGYRAVLSGQHEGAVTFLLNGRRIHRAAHAPYATRLAARALRGHDELAAQAPSGSLLASATVAASAPTVEITAAPPAATGETSATVSFTTQNAHMVQCRLDTRRYTACRAPAAMTGLARGPHIFRVR